METEEGVEPSNTGLQSVVLGRSAPSWIYYYIV